MFSALGYSPFSSIASRPLGAAYVEQEQRPSGNGDRETIAVRTCPRDIEGERAYILYDDKLGRGKVPNIFLTLCRGKNPAETEQFDLRIFDTFSISLFDHTKFNLKIPHGVCFSRSIVIRLRLVSEASRNAKKHIGRFDHTFRHFGVLKFTFPHFILFPPISEGIEGNTSLSLKSFGFFYSSSHWA